MSNDEQLIVLYVLTVLVTLQQCAATIPAVCGDHEEVAPPKDYEKKPHCWIPSTMPLNDTCNCGIAYVPDTYGRCTSCSDNFARNEKNECVRCPKPNERWCSKKIKCICFKNFRRNETQHCVPCDANEESNGYSECKCIQGYKRSQPSNSTLAVGSCKRVPRNYGARTVILGLITVASLGYTCGYLVKHYGPQSATCMKI